MEYKYSQLPDTLKKPFRLLHLLPGSGRDVIRCRLVGSSLDQESSKYEALSYVWGDNSVRTPILIDGAKLRIGNNLRHALLDLRLPNATRVIWADAICINQEDAAERVSQVAMMRDIYQKALQTVVWLGGSAEAAKAESAFTNIQILYDDLMDLKKNPDKPFKSQEGPIFKKLGPDSSIENAILLHSWWGRVWTAQEILLASRATVVVGRHNVDWDVLCAAVNHGSALDIFQEVILGVMPESSAHVVTDVQTLKATHLRESPADELLFYLLRTRTRAATDPRDKIFAVLGLVEGSVRDIGIKPDYEASVDDVYRAATSSLIAASGNLDALGLCFPFKNKVAHELPSWVPDWGSADYLAVPMLEDPLGHRRTSHASRNCSANATWEDAGVVLVVEGHTVDVITGLSLIQHWFDAEAAWDDSEFDTPTKDEDPWYKPFIEAGQMLGQAYRNLTDMVLPLSVYLEWEEFAKNVKPRNPGVEDDPMLAYCLTVSTGTLAPGGLAETKKLFQTWVDSLGPIRRLRAWRMNKEGGWFRFLSLMGYWKSTWNGYGDFFKYTKSTIERRLGATEQGYLCLLPKQTKIGDRLAIVKGGRFPVVLRPLDDGSMRFIGEAYVHGFMDGSGFVEEKCVKFKLR